MSKIGFLFPGQGAQTVGMGKELYNELPGAKRLFDQADAILGIELSKICFEGPEEALNATDVSQPAIYVASLAALEDLKSREPDVVNSASGAAGLSLGEYTALTFAGSLDFEAGLRIVRRRGEAMQAASDAAPSGMTSVLGLDEEKVDELIERVRQSGAGRLWKANMLCPGNIAISGDQKALEEVPPFATELGAMKVVPLAVAGAFHTELMEPAVNSLAEALRESDLKPTQIPVYSNVTAAPQSNDSESIRQTLAIQVTKGVRWEESIRRMIDDGFDTFYEIGPGRVLTSLLKRINRKTPCTSIPAR